MKCKTLWLRMGTVGAGSARPARFRLAMLVGMTASMMVLSTALNCSAETTSSAASEGTSLTIYNQDLGLVKDIRSFELKEGLNELRFEDVAAKIDPTSVSFRSLTAPNAVQVKEQNYQYDLIDPNTILAKSIGKDVTFKIYANDKMWTLSGNLLSAPQAYVADTSEPSTGNVIPRYQGIVVKTAEGIVLNPQGTAQLADLPKGLVSKPSLLWKLDCQKAGTHKTEVSYLTTGFNWHCDYVTVCSADDNKADLSSWVTIDNKSGASYKGASLKLLAGDIHRVQERPVVYMMRAAAGAAQQFEEHAFAEYHMYALSGTTDVNDNETKQLSLFSTQDIATKKLFVFETEPVKVFYEGSNNDPEKVKVKLEIQNTKENHLGMALPKGKVRVYKHDTDGALEFIGEDMIDHTPRDEKIRLYIGDAFDVVGKRTQTNVQQVSDKVQRTSYEISLRNHKDQDITVTAVEHAQGQWKILNSSQPYTKKDATTFEFAPVVPANGEIKMTYTVETKSP